MTPQTYGAHGLVVKSDYPLPMRPVDDDRPPDLVVERRTDGPVPADDPPGGEPLARAEAPDGRLFYSITRTADSVQLRFPELCLIRGDRQLSRVSVQMRPGADDGLAAVLIAGTVVTLHLVLRSELVLHASAVEVDGGVVAFPGMSGMGKSTVATLFALAGHPLVTDDVLRISLPPGRQPVAHRGGLETRLRESAHALAERLPARVTGDGRSAVTLPTSAHTELPLRMCIVPVPERSATTVTVNRLKPAEALTTLLRFPRLVGWQEGETLAHQFGQLGRLVNAVPVVIARLPWGPPFDPALPARVLSSVDLVDIVHRERRVTEARQRE